MTVFVQTYLNSLDVHGVQYFGVLVRAQIYYQFVSNLVTVNDVEEK